MPKTQRPIMYVMLQNHFSAEDPTSIKFSFDWAFLSFHSFFASKFPAAGKGSSRIKIEARTRFR